MPKTTRTRDEIQTEINNYRQLLNQTDYKALKHADGVLSDDDYAETLQQRESFRLRINECEAELAALPEGGIA